MFLSSLKRGFTLFNTLRCDKEKVLSALSTYALRFTDLWGHLCLCCLFILELFYYQLYMVINHCQDGKALRGPLLPFLKMLSDLTFNNNCSFLHKMKNIKSSLLALGWRDFYPAPRARCCQPWALWCLCQLPGSHHIYLYSTAPLWENNWNHYGQVSLDVVVVVVVVVVVLCDFFFPLKTSYMHTILRIGDRKRQT